jgi:hypothetical protein
MINADKPHRWAADTAASVQMYNSWFTTTAPDVFGAARGQVVADVEAAFVATDHFRTITPAGIRNNPAIVGVLRMATAPTVAVDRLAGLAGIPNTLVKTLELGNLPPRMGRGQLDTHLAALCALVNSMLDRRLLTWLDRAGVPEDREKEIAEVVIADRRTAAIANAVLRNDQERRQLQVLTEWLMARGYRPETQPTGTVMSVAPGTFAFRRNVPVRDDEGKTVNLPLDAVIQPHSAPPGALPVLMEAKSAGDFTNTNKRRKEEATKARQLRATYGDSARLVLFLCGYFDDGYLGYEAAEGIDWIWEHRPNDLDHLGL